MRRSTSALSPARNLLILADPVFSASDPRVGRPEAAAHSAALFPRLIQSRKEAAAIAAMLPAKLVQEHLDFAASPAALRAEAGTSHGVIHIVGHTVLDNLRPEKSGIVLSLVDARGDPQRGMLTLREIHNLHLQAGLVTLSACETALGKEIGGEGMLGISHAFLFAGARRVVASLWKVEDSATARLMEVFYRGMYQRGLTPAAALRAAQGELRLDPRWRHPYYWASFVIEGDWR
jgi:CHAT domain-containing protein